MKKSIAEICINKYSTLSFGLKQMDIINRKLLIILNDDETFYSLLSIGDIQRAIINNLPFDTPVISIVRKDISVALESDDLEKVKQRMKNRRNEFMPVLSENNYIKDVIFWEDLFNENEEKQQFNLPVIIMAGGKGSRLKPLTNVIPKPLIPINEKTILEIIMDKFVAHGCNSFYISVNYKADMIRYFFENLRNTNYNINYFQEENPLGTAGSLSLLKGKINQTFFVSNCDIIIDEDYGEILKYHQSNHNEITIIAALKSYPIPYGTLKTAKGGILTEIKEKPELNFKINSGMYIVEPHILNEIPDEKHFHITELIENLICKERKVGVFPVSEKSWRDIGNWKEYLKLISIY